MSSRDACNRSISDKCALSQNHFTRCEYGTRQRNKDEFEFVREVYSSGTPGQIVRCLPFLAREWRSSSGKTLFKVGDE